MREGATSLDQRKVTSTGIRILDSTRREDDTIAYHAVTCHFRTIAKHAVVSNHGVVADVSTLKQEVVVADTGDTIALGTTVDNHILTDDVVVANFHIRLSSTEIKVLRQGGDNAALVNLITFSYTRSVADADEGEDDTVITYLHIVLDIHKGEYLTVITNLSFGANLSFGGYFACHNYSLFTIHFSLFTFHYSLFTSLPLRGPDRGSRQTASC